MKIITLLRSLMLTAGIYSLLFAELLHPVFHDLTAHPEQIKQFTASTQYIAQTDAALNHSGHIPCPVCSCTLHGCCLNDSPPIFSHSYQVIAELSPQKYIFPEITFYSFARAPPVTFS
jgi:hypothetical protein